MIVKKSFLLLKKIKRLKINKNNNFKNLIFFFENVNLIYIDMLFLNKELKNLLINLINSKNFFFITNLINFNSFFCCFIEWFNFKLNFDFFSYLILNKNLNFINNFSKKFVNFKNINFRLKLIFSLFNNIIFENNYIKNFLKFIIKINNFSNLFVYFILILSFKFLNYVNIKSN